MRLVWQKDLDALLRNNLTEEELREYEKSFAEPPASFDDMRRQSNIQMPLFLKAIGCGCRDVFTLFQDESLAICFKVLDGDVSRYSKEREMPGYRRALAKLSRKYARQRRCHINWRAVVCYCDEHKH